MSGSEESILIQAHLLHSEGADPAADRIVREDGRVRMIIVFVPVAVELVENEGVQLIEAVDGRAPVGAVMFGAESLEGAAA
ncbi:MAG: hypothetical protein ACRDSJ_24845 [Rubrobacteraceae bacterium]